MVLKGLSRLVKGAKSRLSGGHPSSAPGTSSSTHSRDLRDVFSRSHTQKQPHVHVPSSRARPERGHLGENGEVRDGSAAVAGGAVAGGAVAVGAVAAPVTSGDRVPVTAPSPVTLGEGGKALTTDGVAVARQGVQRGPFGGSLPTPGEGVGGGSRGDGGRGRGGGGEGGGDGSGVNALHASAPAGSKSPSFSVKTERLSSPAPASLGAGDGVTNLSVKLGSVARGAKGGRGGGEDVASGKEALAPALVENRSSSSSSSSSGESSPSTSRARDRVKDGEADGEGGGGVRVEWTATAAEGAAGGMRGQADRSPSPEFLEVRGVVSRDQVVGKETVSNGQGMVDFLQSWQRYICEQTAILVALLLWVGCVHVSVLLVWYCSILGLVTGHPLALAVFALGVALLLLPVEGPGGPPEWGLRVARFVVETVPRHFPLRVKIEDPSAFKKDEAYIIAMEPHSVLPLGAIAFSHLSSLVPFQRIKILGSSALNFTPICRHLWTWMGMAPVSRASFQKLLTDGYTCVLVPGGVQECLHLSAEEEVVFLRKRKGFVRLALATGAPLVPAFCFGQRDTFHYWYPRGMEWFRRLSRWMQYAPIVYWGIYGGPLPRSRPMLLVVGRPIPVPKVAEPPDALVEKFQAVFIQELEALYNKHREEAGASHIRLVVK